MAIDAHIHFEDERFDGRRDAWLHAAKRLGFTGMILPGAHPDQWDHVERIGTQAAMPWTLGIHPWSLTTSLALDAWCAQLASRPTPHGIGEVGLDYHRGRTTSAKELQHASTRRLCQLALQRKVPVILHCVRAHDALLRLLRDQPSIPSAMIHGFTGATHHVRMAQHLGVFLSFGFATLRSKKITASFVATPDHLVLLETDAPDQRMAGKQQPEPSDLLELAEALAPLRGTTKEALLKLCADNARRLFPTLTPWPAQSQ